MVIKFTIKNRERGNSRSSLNVSALIMITLLADKMYTTRCFNADYFSLLSSIGCYGSVDLTLTQNTLNINQRNIPWKSLLLLLRRTGKLRAAISKTWTGNSSRWVVVQSTPLFGKYPLLCAFLRSSAHNSHLLIFNYTLALDFLLTCRFRVKPSSRRRAAVPLCYLIRKMVKDDYYLQSFDFFHPPDIKFSIHLL